MAEWRNFMIAHRKMASTAILVIVARVVTLLRTTSRLAAPLVQ